MHALADRAGLFARIHRGEIVVGSIVFIAIAVAVAASHAQAVEAASWSWSDPLPVVPRDLHAHLVHGHDGPGISGARMAGLGYAMFLQRWIMIGWMVKTALFG